MAYLGLIGVGSGVTLPGNTDRQEITALETRPPEILRFATFEVDVRAGELRKQGKRVKLQEQPFHVLTALLQRPGEVVTREELRNENWPPDTFVDFDNSLNTAINKLREALGDSADNPRFVETLPRRGYRFIAPVSFNDGIEKPTPGPVQRPGWKIVFAVIAVFAIGAAGTAALYLRWKKPRLTEKDTIVLADFVNTTGDPVFDDTLKQGLRMQLEQSPFLNILSDEKIAEGAAASLPFFKRAVELDPNFAMAYGRMAIAYGPTGENALSIENMRKAYELRTHISDRERLYIEAHYYDSVTEEMEKAAQVTNLGSKSTRAILRLTTILKMCMRLSANTRKR